MQRLVLVSLLFSSLAQAQDFPPPVVISPSQVPIVIQGPVIIQYPISVKVGG